MNKILRFSMLLTFFFILVSTISYALNLQVVYSPYTGKLDYVRTSNFTGENLSSDFIFANGKYITGIDINWSEVQVNDSLFNNFVNRSGDSMTGDLNMDGNQLTSVGALVMNGIITSQNIIPDTTDLYSLGNSTNWYDKMWVKNIYAESIDTDSLNSGTINSSEINTTNLNSDNLDVEENISLGQYTITGISNYVIVLP